MAPRQILIWSTRKPFYLNHSLFHDTLNLFRPWTSDVRNGKKTQEKRSEVLLLIIGFIGRAEGRTGNRHLFELRLVNREFRHLLQPIFFGSVQMPPRCGANSLLTEDVRELLRLIEGNPSLAKDIKELSYYETGPGDMIKDDYCLEELNEDCNIFLRYARELSQKSATFVFSVRPSDKRAISRQYTNMCAPLLLSRDLPTYGNFHFTVMLEGDMPYY
ncbi:hypothetical protein BZA77DRAFT_291873 [Pyronema omphalodes]|nr:hypothetical protein BZA77DRAFT_296899 [Pyronema omphalodes]KAI5817943.1 hypothetical protein BZA77DRAFT_291873 [Pyronema omphalodes]